MTSEVSGRRTSGSSPRSHAPTLPHRRLRRRSPVTTSCTATRATPSPSSAPFLRRYKVSASGSTSNTRSLRCGDASRFPATSPFLVFDSTEEGRAWLPDGWTPDAFDIDETNELIAAVTADPVAVVEELASLLELSRNRGSRGLRAALAHPAAHRTTEISVEAAAELTGPFRVLLDVIGDGAALTGAGYLRPAQVEQIAQRTGVADWWIGKANPRISPGRSRSCAPQHEPWVSYPCARDGSPRLGRSHTTGTTQRRSCDTSSAASRSARLLPSGRPAGRPLPSPGARHPPSSGMSASAGSCSTSAGATAQTPTVPLRPRAPRSTCSGCSRAQHASTGPRTERTPLSLRSPELSCKHEDVDPHIRCGVIASRHVQVPRAACTTTFRSASVLCHAI